MKNTRRLLTLLIVLSALAAVAAGSVSYYESTGASSFHYFINQTGSSEIHTVHQKYDLYRSYENGEDRLYLIQSQSSIAYELEAEGVRGQLKWDVRTGTKLENSLWNRTEEATSLEINHDFGLVVSGLAGCCGQIAGYRVFDIKSGKFIMAFNNFKDAEVVRNPFVLSVPNSDLSPRLIGLVSVDSTRDLEFETAPSGMVNVGVLKYASKTDLFQSVQIDMDTSAGFAPSILEVQLLPDPRVPESDRIEFRQDTALLWNLDSQTDPRLISGVVLKVVLNGGQGDKVIIIPVTRDRLNIKKAVIPRGVSLRLL